MTLSPCNTEWSTVTQSIVKTDKLLDPKLYMYFNCHYLILNRSGCCRFIPYFACDYSADNYCLKQQKLNRNRTLKGLNLRNSMLMVQFQVSYNHAVFNIAYFIHLRKFCPTHQVKDYGNLTLCLSQVCS